MGRDPWNALVMAIAGDLEHLRHTPVTLVFHENGQVLSRTLVLSVPPSRVWGLPLQGCPTTSCPSKAFDFRSEVPRKSALLHEKARFSCNLCGFRTAWISRPSWIKDVGALYPRRFWFDSPVHRSHLAAFNTSLLEHKADCREDDTREKPDE
jgi:hypothetical protein